MVRDRWVSVPDGAAATVFVTGDLDRTMADEFVESVISELGQGGEVRVDLARVEFIDSAGVHALFKVASSADKHGAKVLFANPSPIVRHVLGLVGGLDVLPVADDRLDSR